MKRKRIYLAQGRREGKTAALQFLKGWVSCIKQLQKGHRRKNRLIKRLRAEIAQLLDEGFTR